MSRAVFDASLILKWYLPDDALFERAVTIRLGVDAVAPALMLVELANALWKYVRAGLLDIEEACAVVASVSDRIETTPDIDLLEDAQRLSASLQHPVYDCLYLALASKERLPLVTVDKRLAAQANLLGLEVTLLEQTK